MSNDPSQRPVEPDALGRHAGRRSKPPSAIRRWGFACLFACLAIGAVPILVLQQLQINQVSETVKTLLPVAQAEADVRQSRNSPETRTESSAALSEADEMQLLQEKIDKLNADIAPLNRVRAENEGLRAQLATPPQNTNPTTGGGDLQAEKDRALKIACINNLKQMGLGARLWASDNKDIYPPDILSMSNELNTPKILVCPADSREVATDWGSYSAVNCSYEYLAPAASDLEPTRVLFRCPIHGTVCLCDGSVQSLTPEVAAKALVQREGKLYLEFNHP